jgi:hypothetical protein
MSEIEQQIKAKIEKIGTPLKEWDISIYRGILTGYNEAFIITKEQRDELIAKSPNSIEVIKPILRGRDIKRYSYEFADLYLLYIPWHFPLHNDPNIKGASVEAEQEFEKQYPAVYEHLLSHKKKLSARNKAETGIRYEWYALQRWGADYWEDFQKEIIAWQRITQEPTFCITGNGMVILDSMAFLVAGKHTKYVTAILNSKLIHFYVNQFVSQYGETGFRLSNQYVKQIPIPKILKEEYYKYEMIVDKILLENTENLSNELNNLVYKLYNLNDNEIKIIENN